MMNFFVFLAWIVTGLIIVYVFVFHRKMRAFIDSIEQKYRRIVEILEQWQKKI